MRNSKEQINQLIKKLGEIFRRKSEPPVQVEAVPQNQKVNWKDKLLNAEIWEKIKESFSPGQSATPSRLKTYFTNPDSRKSIHFVFLFVLFTSIAYQFGKTISYVLQLKPTVNNLSVTTFEMPKLSLRQVELEMLKSNNPFKVQTTFETEKEKPKIDFNVPCLTAQVRSPLSTKLISTIVMQDQVKSMAAVQKGSTLESLRYGDKIDNVGRIDRIERMKLIMRNMQSGACEYLGDGDVDGKLPTPKIFTPQQGKALSKGLRPEGIENDGSNFKIKKNLLVDKMKDPMAILRQAKAIPVTNPDGTLSFKIVEIEPGSLYTYLGINENDIITEVNGRRIQSQNEILNLFAKITSMKKLELTFERNGIRQTQNYVINE